MTWSHHLKTFLQLKGISVANYNMGCNFSITAAMRLMVQYDLHILAIQEHTPWNRTLSDPELNCIQHTCDKWGFLVTISKLQITIIDKQMAACFWGANTNEDGQIMQSRLEFSHHQFVNFIALYGIPHSANTPKCPNPTENDEDSHMSKMEYIQWQLRHCIIKAIPNNELVYVYGDLQDTPDSSKLFHYGSCQIPKQLLGIAQLCDSMGFKCTIY
jgi:hypothetical protein